MIRDLLHLLADPAVYLTLAALGYLTTAATAYAVGRGRHTDHEYARGYEQGRWDASWGDYAATLTPDQRRQAWANAYGPVEALPAALDDDTWTQIERYLTDAAEGSDGR